MVTWSAGSLSSHVGTLVGWSNIPTGVSGTTLDVMSTQEVNFVNTYTGDNISPDGFAEKYQPTLIDLLMADVLISIESSEGGVDNVKLGELSVSSGKGGNAQMAVNLKQSAIKRLRELGRKVRYTRVLAGC